MYIKSHFLEEGACLTVDWKERYLYHQVHPLKLFTDWATGAVALVFLWRHQLGRALVVGIIPSMLVSLAIVRLVDLNRYKASRMGKYVEAHMTRGMEAVRFAGFGLMGIGAWWKMPWLIAAGLILILLGWARGLFAR